MANSNNLDLNEVPAMKTDPKYIFFTDFDGTITLDDSTQLLVHSNVTLLILRHATFLAYLQSAS